MNTQPTDAEIETLWHDSNPNRFEAISFARAVLAKCGTPKAAPGELSDWKPLKTSKEGRDAVRSFFREKLKRHDFDEYIMKSLAADFACVLGGYLRAAPQQEVSQDTMYLLRRLLSNQHTLTGPEFRAELEKIVGEAYQQEAREPVAWMWQHEETGRTGFVDCWQIENGFQENNPQLRLVAKLYATPQPAPLSDDVVQKTWALLDELEKLRGANRDEEDWDTLNKLDDELRAAIAAQGGKA